MYNYSLCIKDLVGDAEIRCTFCGTGVTKDT